MKVFSKNQVKLIILLNCIIVILFAGLFFLLPSNDDGDTVGGTVLPPPPIQHTKIRQAQPALTEGVDWINNLGGTFGEELTAAFIHNDKIHIFGNTTSTDCDFDGEGKIFMATLSIDGTTESFVQFGTNATSVSKVLLAEGGYILACDNVSHEGEPYLMKVDYDGKVVDTVTVNTIAEETVEDFLYDDGGYIAVIREVHKNTRNTALRIVKLDANLELLGDAFVRRLQNVSYISLLPKPDGKYVLAANTKSVKTEFMFIAEIDFLNQPTFHDLDIGFSYKGFDFVPCVYGYMSVLVTETTPGVLIINDKYQKRTVNFANDTSAAVNAQIISDGVDYYVYLNHSGDLSKLIKLDETLNLTNTILNSTNWAGIHDIYYRQSIVIAAKTAEGVTLITADGDKLCSFGNPNAKKCLLLNDGKSLIAISQADGVDSFGADDIYIHKLSPLIF